MPDSLVLMGGGLALMFVLITLHVPVGVAMAVTGVAGFAMTAGMDPALSIIASESANAFGSADLATIPLFVLMGAFASMAGLSEDLYRLAYALVGHRRGGLALATVGGCAGFGAVCGSSIATAATFGRVSLPSMLSRGYHPGVAAGTVASGGTLGILIPPSSIMVIYAVLSQELIIDLYVAALLPALLAIALHTVAIGTYSAWRPAEMPVGPKATTAERWQAVRESWQVLLLAFAVIGGMAMGVFTATESAAVGAIMAAVFALMRRSLNRKSFKLALNNTAATVGMIYVLLIGASLFGYFAVVTGAPQDLVNMVSTSGIPVWLGMLCIIVLYLIAGAIFDEVAAIVITMPFVLPLIKSWGFDAVWWGIINVTLVEIGMLTPPLGMNVFVVKGIARDISLGAIYRGVMPFVASNIVRLGILMAFPVISLWLPMALK